MKNYLLILSIIVIAILAVLLWINKRESNKELEKQRKDYEDSLQHHANVQARLQMELAIIKKEKTENDKKDSIREENFKRENSRLHLELKKARTPKVEELITAEPQLRHYIKMYDSLVTHQQFRIDTLLVEKRIAAELCARAEAKQNEILDAKEKENEFLRAEVDRLYNELGKTKNKLRKQKILMWISILLNAIPRWD